MRVGLFGEQGEHVVAHEADRLRDRANIDARLEALDAVADKGSYIGGGEDLAFDQKLEKGERGRAIGDGDALGAVTKKVEHDFLSISLDRR